MTTTYFAVDGSYGDAEEIIIVDTTDWSDDEWYAIRECTDSSRHGIVTQIIANAGDAAQLELEFHDDAG